MSETNNNMAPSPDIPMKVVNEEPRKDVPSAVITIPVETAPVATGSKDKKPPPAPQVPYFRLYRYATTSELTMIVIALIASCCLGALLPLMTIVFGDILTVFSTQQAMITANPMLADQINSDFRKALVDKILYLLYIAAGSFVLAFTSMSLWIISGERQTRRIREEYLHAILKQDMGWLDGQRVGDLTNRISNDTQLIQEGISDKCGIVAQQLTVFLSGFVIAFTKGPKLAGVLLCVLPIMAAIGITMVKLLSKKSANVQDLFAEAGAHAEEILSSIRTVVAFGGEARELKEYKRLLKKGGDSALFKATVIGTGVGAILGTLFCTYGLAFWYGSRLVADEEMKPGEVLTTFFSFIIGASSLGIVGPQATAFGTATGAAYRVFEVIDRKPTIDASAENQAGEKMTSIQGDIVINEVKFTYPTRPGVQVLHGVSLTIKAGQTVALVGSSGSGKSTIVQLLERFYDPDEGTITLDGKNLRELNPLWLRQQLGLVGQEPVLFAGSISQNIGYGALDGIGNQDEIEAAAKMANAHDFIMRLPQKYDTIVGERGALLSGGQKQRIAIARALLKKPSILLLDESTSALDTRSERIVQRALDKASEGRTTIAIAHRLSTIRNADLIVVMHQGVVVEQGTHNELLAMKGRYSELVAAQAMKEDGNAETDAALNDPEALAKLEAAIAEEERNAAAAVRASVRASAKDPVVTQSLKQSNAPVGGVSATPKSTPPTLEMKQRAKAIKMPWKRLLGLMSPYFREALGGSIGAMINGAVMPIFSLIFATILSVLIESGDQLKKDADFWSSMFAVIGAIQFLGQFLSNTMFGILASRLAVSMRGDCMQRILYQHISWFDQEDNSSGILTAKLATEAEAVELALNKTIGFVLQSVVTVCIGLGIAFYNGWKLTLVILSALPAMAGAGYLQMKSLQGFGDKAKKAYLEAARVACEAIGATRTVAALTREGTFEQRYKKQLEIPYSMGVQTGIFAGLGFGLGQAVPFASYALAYWYGGELIITDGYVFENMARVLYAIMFTGVALGQVSSFMPDFVKSKLAAAAIFELLDTKSKIDVRQLQGRTEEAQGHVIADSLAFRYPTRPDISVLKNVSLHVERGRTIALVGGSGCGKSTMIGLLERFYDVDKGTIKLDGSNITTEWQLRALRSQQSLVGQEPVLFGRTIGENIAYGWCGDEPPSQAAIENAARQANIHQFIADLPQGYQTPVGGKGAQLSGGQKQRVAIARALIRNPKILLLDEATAALDSESERVVQAALDNAAKGRTTIVVAHRLSTIQNADWIYVFNEGLVAEEGTHNDLVARDGLYRYLVNAQSLAAEKKTD